MTLGLSHVNATHQVNLSRPLVLQTKNKDEKTTYDKGHSSETINNDNQKN